MNVARALVILLAVVGVVLFVLLRDSGSPSAPAAHAVTSAEPDVPESARGPGGPGGSGGALSGGAPLLPESPEPTEERVAAADVAPASMPASITPNGIDFTGILREPSGAPIVGEDVHLDLVTPEGKYEELSAQDGSFRFHSLKPGRYALDVRSPSHEPLHEEFELAAEPLHVARDIVLVPWSFVAVRVRTPEGEPLAPLVLAAPQLDYTFRVRAIATREPLRAGEVIADPTAGGRALGVYGGIGAMNSALLPQRLTPDEIGRLRLDALPVHVSLVLSGRVLDTQRVDVAQRDVVFTLALESLERDLGTLRLRPIDARTHKPPPRYYVGIAYGEGGAQSSGESDRDGVFERRGLPVGDVLVSVQSAGHMRWTRRVRIEAGELTDLGDIELEAGLELRGHVLDASGERTSHLLQLVGAGESLDTAPAEVSAGRENGFWLRELAPVRYVVRSGGLPVQPARGESWQSRAQSETVLREALRPRVVDMSGGAQGELVLQLERAGTLEIALEDSELRGTELVITNAAGLPARSVAFSGERAILLPLVPDTYHLVWRRANEVVLERDVSVQRDVRTTLRQ